MTYGYCCISTKKQNIERQVRNILDVYPDAEITKETYTGTKKTGRLGLQCILAKVESGDTIVFDSVIRMSRNADEGVELYMELYKKGVNLVFLKERHIDTDTYKNAMNSHLQSAENENYFKATSEVLMILARKQIKQAFEQSQKEVDDLQQRTKEGLKTARLQGKQIGQAEGRKLKIKKKKEAVNIISSHAEEFGGSLSDKECMVLAKVSRGTYFKYKQELRDIYHLLHTATTQEEINAVVEKHEKYMNGEPI